MQGAGMNRAKMGGKQHTDMILHDEEMWQTRVTRFSVPLQFKRDMWANSRFFSLRTNA